MNDRFAGSTRRSRSLGLIHHHRDLAAEMFLVEAERRFAIPAEIQLGIQLHRWPFLRIIRRRLLAAPGTQTTSSGGATDVSERSWFCGSPRWPVSLTDRNARTAPRTKTSYAHTDLEQCWLSHSKTMRCDRTGSWPRRRR